MTFPTFLRLKKSKETTFSKEHDPSPKQSLCEMEISEIAKLLIYLKDDHLQDLVRDSIAYQISNAGSFRKADLSPLRQVFADLPDNVSEAQSQLRQLLTRYPLLRSESKEKLLSRLVVLGEVWRAQFGTLLRLKTMENIAQTLQRYDIETLTMMGSEPTPAEAKVFTASDLKAFVAQTVKETMAQAKKEEPEE
jgi:hypothetical protein